MLMILLSGTAQAQEPTAAEVCEEWSNHLHNDDERSAYDRICLDLDTPAASSSSTTVETTDDLAMTEEAEMWVQLFDSGNQFAPTAAGLLVYEDFLGDVEIIVGGVTCDLYDEYVLANDWAIIPLCSGSDDPGYLKAPETLRVEMQEDWDEPTSYFRCLESNIQQEEGRRTYACESLAPPESVVPTEMQVQLFDSGNRYAPTAAGLLINVDFLGDVEIKVGGVTCDLYDEYVLANDWAITPLCSGSNDPGYQNAPETFRIEMQEDWDEPTSYFRCDESTEESEEEQRVYTCEFLRRR